MTDEQLKAIRERLEAPYQGVGAHTDDELATCYQDIAALLAEVERIRAWVPHLIEAESVCLGEGIGPDLKPLILSLGGEEEP